MMIMSLLPDYLVAVLLLLFSFAGVKNVKGNFNFYVDKEEFHRITGGTLSQVYLVRDGVVNDYALSYSMTVPYLIHHLDFKWQATTKKPVHYEMLFEFSDFYALLQPSANISKVGRLPHKLETFRITLPCSGRLTTEVPVILRFTFHVKHTLKNNSHGHNVTHVNVRRNKICLLKDPTHGLNRDQQTILSTNGRSANKPNSNPAFIATSENPAVPPLLPPPNVELSSPNPTAPSLLLAGLLGACAVTASIASVVFFICLKRRLQKMDNSPPLPKTGSSLNTGTSASASSSDPTSTTPPDDSPACLLRSAQIRRKWDKGGSGEGLGPPPVPNSYMTIASFWNDILSQENGIGSGGGIGKAGATSINGNYRKENSTFAGHLYHNKLLGKLSVNDVSGTGRGNGSGHPKGNDVSPYAYAQIIPPPPPLIEWYQSSAVPSSNTHIYANHMAKFGSPIHKPRFGVVSSSSSSVGNEYGGHRHGQSVDGSYDKEDKNCEGKYENYGGRSTGSGSLIQVDGFQCSKNYAKESVIERFL